MGAGEGEGSGAGGRKHVGGWRCPPCPPQRPLRLEPSGHSETHGHVEPEGAFNLRKR